MKKSLIILLLVLSTSLFGRTLDEIKASGTLKIAIRVRDGVLNENKTSGFHYDLIKKFCELHSVKPELIIKTALDEYFTKPIFQEADIVVDNITITPEREKVMKFVKVLPVKQILISKKGHAPIFQFSQLAQEVIVVNKGSSYYTRLQELEKRNATIFNYYFSETTQAQLADMLAGKGTLTVLDSNLASLHLTSSDLQPQRAISPREDIGWGYELSNTTVGDALAAFVQSAKDNNVVSTIWDEYFEGIDYKTYLSIAQ